jgi:hypothetical protein
MRLARAGYGGNVARVRTVRPLKGTREKLVRDCASILRARGWKVAARKSGGWNAWPPGMDRSKPGSVFTDGRLIDDATTDQ